MTEYEKPQILEPTMTELEPTRTELKPCPFCGGEARIVTAVGESWVLCDKCKATTEAHTSKQFAIGAWNRRVVEYRKPTTIGELERDNAKLREMCERLLDRLAMADAMMGGGILDARLLDDLRELGVHL